ncbi:MAG: hypothetical protein ACRYFA_09175 [Janthinobacterium lividum]
MKVILAVFISIFSLNASAQFLWHKKYTRSPQLTLLKSPAKSNFTELSSASFNSFNTNLGPSRYRIDAEEASIMRDLRRSKRYGQAALRIQFDNLANFYFRQNRFSEAKWYLLRSNAISRQQKNYTQIVGSLMVLADVKSILGDFVQADADLSEAKIIASSHSLLPDLLLIEQHSKQIHSNKETGVKVENRYSDIL